MIPFEKWESIGNDFVLVEASIVASQNLSELARTLCDRKFGIGSDGLLVVSDGPKLQMFNPDGSEDFCGNGLRCAAAWFGQRSSDSEFSIEHLGKHVPVRLNDDGSVECTLPAPTYAPSGVPVNSPEPFIDQMVEGVKGSALSTGSTHFVAFVPTLPVDDDFYALSPRIEHADIFPERTSIMWCRRTPNGAEIRIWERGAGETLGCGTGATAVAVELFRTSQDTEPKLISSKGGQLKIQVTDLDSPVTVIGVPRFVYSGQTNLVSTE